MKITVKGQQAIVTDDFLVANSVGIYECEFEFDSSWDGYAKNSVWQLNNDEPKESIISSGVAEVPWEVLVNGGFIRVGVYGTKDEKVMPTVWGEKRKVHLGTPTGSIGTEPTPSIYAQILAVATEAKDIAEDVAEDWANVYATAETLEPNESASVVFEDNTFKFGIPKGVKGDTGETGFSPTITVIDISGGHRVTITDEQGMESFDVLDGHDGQNGADGYSPTIAVSNITGGHRLTITDKNGTRTVDVMDGEQGIQGETGNGISSITKTATVGKVDTYTITYTDGTTTTFDVTNGEVSEAELEEALIDKADVITNTASGTIASFSDGAEMPVKSLEVEINAVQDLHGQANPYPAGGGKNKFNSSDKRVSKAIFGNESIGQQAVLYDSSATDTYVNIAYLTVGTWTLSYSMNGTATATGSRVGYICDADGKVVQRGITTWANTATVLNIVVTAEGWLWASVDKNTTNLQLEEGSTATAYAPYSNICPISGRNAVNVVRTGKNLWDDSIAPTNIEAYSISGTAGTYTGRNLYLPQGTYTFSYNGTTTTYIYGNVVNADGSWVSTFRLTSPAPQTPTFTLSDGQYAKLYVASGTVTELTNGKVQLEVGSTATAYEPYNGDTYPISLGQTVYGGVLDVTSGELTVTHTIMDLGDLNWVRITNYNNPLFWADLPSDAKGYTTATESDNGSDICSIFGRLRDTSGYYNKLADGNYLLAAFGLSFVNRIYARYDACESASDFKTAVTGQKLVYELATPTTIQLTPTEVTTLLGDNNIWADCGDVAVLYRADTKAYIDGTIVDVPLAMIAPIETGTTSSKAYAVGEYFILNGTQFCKAKTAIASGATFTLNTNYTVTTIANELKALQ